MLLKERLLQGNSLVDILKTLKPVQLIVQPGITEVVISELSPLVLFEVAVHNAFTSIMVSPKSELGFPMNIRSCADFLS